MESDGGMIDSENEMFDRTSGSPSYRFWIGVHIMMLLGFGGLMQYLVCIVVSRSPCLALLLSLRPWHNLDNYL